VNRIRNPRNLLMCNTFATYKTLKDG
jgi:hypothetical protein